MRLILIPLLFFLTDSCTTEKPKCEWESLFNGENLEGWEALPGGEWKVVDGSIAGFSPRAERKHGILLSKKQYSDFEVKLKYKAVKGNSGFYFRVKKINRRIGQNDSTATKCLYATKHSS